LWTRQHKCDVIGNAAQNLAGLDDFEGNFVKFRQYNHNYYIPLKKVQKRRMMEREKQTGEYTIDVRLAGAPSDSAPVMSLGPVDIPGCAKVQVVAKLIPGEPVPTLVPEIREKQK
jgi:hypothetical protein